MLTAYHGAPAYLVALATTLVLASFLTPRKWWRRPTARGAAVLGGGTWAIGALLLYFVAVPPPADVPSVAMALPDDVPAQHMAVNLPLAGQRYRVHRDLNVRSAAGVGADRQGVIPAGAVVRPTGEHAGDWWQIRYDDRAGAQLGWTSSLWLRRTEE